MKKKTIFKIALALPALVAVVFVGMVGWVMLNLWLPNYGCEFGYYGQFNRVQHVIEDMPNVDILDHSQHQDVSLEDFGFALMVDGTQKVDVTFSENSTQMRMRSKKKIREFILNEMDSNN